MKVHFGTPVEFVPGLRRKEKNWWSILETRTTSPIFNQFTSGLLHSVQHLIIYNFKPVFEFVCHIGNSLIQQRVRKIYSSSYLFFLVMVRHISIFNIFISNVLHSLLNLIK